MNNSEFKQEVVTKLLELPYAHTINHNQIALRCQFCGDSRKDPRKTRFYVQPNINNDNPIFYNCFNCGESGILTPSVLRVFDIHDLHLNSRLVSMNKSNNKRINGSFNNKKKKYNYYVPLGRDNTRDEIKKNYIENRLGLSFTFKELQRLKIILSLDHMISYNDIDRSLIQNNLITPLDKYYVGFLSIENELVICRDITDKNKLRYYKYGIIPNITDAKKIYTIPNKIDLLSDDTITINLAEGPFDILGVYYHINKQELKNQIYVAVGGSAYTSVIKYFISLGLFGDNIVVNIYSDSDKDLYWYNKTIQYISPFVKKINIFYNTKDKDYGVHKNKINIKKVKYK